MFSQMITMMWPRTFFVHRLWDIILVAVICRVLELSSQSRVIHHPKFLMIAPCANSLILEAGGSSAKPAQTKSCTVASQVGRCSTSINLLRDNDTFILRIRTATPKQFMELEIGISTAQGASLLREAHSHRTSSAQLGPNSYE